MLSRSTISAFENKASSRTTLFRCFTEMKRGWGSLKAEENTESILSSVIPKDDSPYEKYKFIITAALTKKELIRRNKKEFNVGSAAMHKIIHWELQIVKLVYRWLFIT